MNKTLERGSRGKVSSHTVDQVADDLQMIYANESIDEGDLSSPDKLRISEPRLVPPVQEGDEPELRGRTTPLKSKLKRPKGLHSKSKRRSQLHSK